MIALYRDPEGKKVFARQATGTTEETTLGITEQAEKCKILALEKEIESLQAQLKEKQKGKPFKCKSMCICMMQYIFIACLNKNESCCGRNSLVCYNLPKLDLILIS